jgi:hypothetical protein
MVPEKLKNPRARLQGRKATQTKHPPSTTNANTIKPSTPPKCSRQSFTQHLVKLMTSWAVVCDVYFLEPQRQRPGEAPDAFAARVQEMIARKVRRLCVVDCVFGLGRVLLACVGARLRAFALLTSHKAPQNHQPTHQTINANQSQTTTTPRPTCALCRGTGTSNTTT